jgi:hypothetical protein
MSTFNQTFKIRNQYILIILITKVQKWMDGVKHAKVGFLEA